MEEEKEEEVSAPMQERFCDMRSAVPLSFVRVTAAFSLLFSERANKRGADG